MNAVTLEQFQQKIEVFAPVVDQTQWMLPEDTEEWNKAHPYVERHRTMNGKCLDDLIPKIIEWLRNPKSTQLDRKSKTEIIYFKQQVSKFFLNSEGRLYQ